MPRPRDAEPARPLEPTATGTRLRLRVQPRAARSGVGGLHGDAIRVWVAAPPTDGAANEALIRLLADRLGVPRAALRLAAGHSVRSKVVLVEGLDPGEVAARLGV